MQGLTIQSDPAKRKHKLQGMRRRATAQGQATVRSSVWLLLIRLIRRMTKLFHVEQLIQDASSVAFAVPDFDRTTDPVPPDSQGPFQRPAAGAHVSLFPVLCSLSFRYHRVP
jgi:hypothetical protein